MYSCEPAYSAACLLFLASCATCKRVLSSKIATLVFNEGSLSLDVQSVGTSLGSRPRRLSPTDLVVQCLHSKGALSVFVSKHLVGKNT